ncbi:MAG: phage tail protein, partial [Armatimonadota bacterium]
SYDSVDEINYAANAYPNIALLGVRIQASDQLSGDPPRISALVSGRTVRTLTAGALSSGETFSRNPVECVIDLLTHTRYGLGGYITDADLVLSAFQSAKDYCDQTVSDPVSEIRHRLDIVLDEQRRAFDWIDVLLSMFRGVLVESDGKWRLTVDHTGSVSQIFSDANILKGSFKNAWVSLSEEYDQVEVLFLDEGNNYIRESVRFPTTGNKIKQVQLYGITRRSHALREAKYHMNAISALSRYCEFDTSIEALAVEVGDLIQVSHNVPQWGFSGRVVRTRVDDVAPTAAMISAQGVTEFSAANLIDGDMLTKGWNLAGAVVGDWVRFDFGVGNEKNLTRVRIYQDGAGYTGTYDVQHSTDGAVWTDASTAWAPTAAGWNERTWAGPGTRRFWRLRVAGAGTGHVFDIEWATAASKHVITIDRADLPTSGLSGYAVAIRHSSDAVEQINTVEAVTVLANSAEGYPRAEVRVNTVFARPPVARDSIWAFGLTAEVAKTFRVVAITLNEDLTRHVTAIEYNASIYDSTGLVLPARSPSLLPLGAAPPNSVTNVTLRERRTVNVGGDQSSFIEVVWNQPTWSVNAGQFAYARVYTSLYEGTDATLLINSAVFAARSDRYVTLVGPFPANMRPQGTRVRVYVVAVSITEIAQPLSSAAFADITLTTDPPRAIIDHFTYEVSPGDDADPQLWIVERSNVSIPEIGHTQADEILIHTGATSGWDIAIHARRGIHVNSPMLRTRAEFRMRIETWGTWASGTWLGGLTVPSGSVGLTGHALVFKGTNANTIRFDTQRTTSASIQTTDNIAVDPLVFHTYVLEVDAGEAATRLYVDGILVATHTTHPAGSAASTPRFFIQNGEAVDKHMRLDYVNVVPIF